MCQVKNKQLEQLSGLIHEISRLSWLRIFRIFLMWCAMSGLMCWIASKKLDIIGLHVYMDDFFGWDFADNLVRFHGRQCPKRQVQLLLLWESLACPFEDRKQDHGEQLKIIGFWVDINLSTISIPPPSITDLVKKIEDFLGTSNRKPSLRAWQCLRGYLNWALNVFPWGCPALSELYRKMSGKRHSSGGIPINGTVCSDLSWLMSELPKSIGILIAGT